MALRTIIEHSIGSVNPTRAFSQGALRLYQLSERVSSRLQATASDFRTQRQVPLISPLPSLLLPPTLRYLSTP